MRIALALLFVCLLGCSGGGGNKLPAADTPSAAAQALMRSLVIAGGQVKHGGLPDASNQIATLIPQATDPMVPGNSTLMPLDMDNPEQATNPGQSLLMQLQGASDHFEVPVTASTDGPSQLDFQLTTKADACKDLCNKLFTVALTEAMQMKDGTVTEHAMHDLQLDCRKSGDAARCGGSSSPSKGAAGKSGAGAKDAGTPSRNPDDGGSVLSGLGDAALPIDAAGIGLGFDAAGFDAAGFVRPDAASLPGFGDASISQFPCTSGSFVAIEKLCDGVKDCSDGVDEMICIPCTDGVGLYSALQHCDGKKQCADGSDEDSCDFTCNDGTHVPLTKICDGVNDCTDASDELPCQFPCGDGTSVPSTKICNGVMDCKNGADEAKSMCP